MPRFARAALLLLVTVAAGCSLVGDGGMFGRKPQAEPAATVAPLESQLALEHLDLLERLSSASPAGQAEIVELVRREVEVQPGISNRLRYALVLALPGHAGSDPVAARSALGTLLATPERLLPAEQALARVMLQDVNARLMLLSENQNLVSEARQADQERAQALNRRLQAQSAENARLKQELQDALAKLEAVADLERSMAERQAAPKVRQP